MESKPHWIAYDWFKLIVAIPLLILFMLLMLSPNQAGPVDTASLPAYPQVAYLLNYDHASQTLLDANGTPQFSLSADGKGWQPFIPESLKTTLPQDVRIISVGDGYWMIFNSSGMPLYRWNEATQTWVLAPPEVPGPLTEFLPYGFQTLQNPDGSWIIADRGGVPLYVWDVEARSWVVAGPQIPDDLAKILPPGYQMTHKANGRWAIQDGAGKDLYTWDTQVMAWVQVVPEFLPGTTPAMQTLSPEPTGMPVP